MIKVIPYANGHFDFLDVRYIYAGDSDLKERLNSLIGGGSSLSYTLVVDNRPISLVGGCILWPGVMEVWMVTTDIIMKFPLEFHKKVADLIAGFATEFNIKRFQAVAQADFSMGKKWLESLGFESEGLLKQYGPEGKDYYMFARVR